MTEDPCPAFKLSVDVTIKDPAWLDAVPPLKSLAGEVTCEVLGNRAAWCHWPEGEITGPVEVSFCFGDDEFVRALNKKFRAKDKTTNVLSFPVEDSFPAPVGEPLALGDIVLASGVVNAEARKDGIPVRDHTTHLLVHGLLHLLGFSHENEDQAERMEALEIEVLGGFGIANPYLAPGKQRQAG